MTFKRLLMPAFVLGIIFIMGSAAYAQPVITCGVGAPNGPTARAANTGHTEPVAAGPTGVPGVPGGGTVRVTCANTGTAGTPGVVVLTISFGVPITNTTAHPPQAPIRLANFVGDFTAANVGIGQVNNSAGTIVIGLGTPLTTSTVSPSTGITFTANSTTSFEILGVLVSTNGRSAAVNATLTSSGGVNIGSPAAGTGGSVEVITSVLAPLGDPTTPTGSLPSAVTGLPNLGTTAIAGGAAILSGSGGGVKTNFTIRIQEGYQDLFKESSQFNGGAVFPASPASDTQVNIVLSNIPSGLDISGCAAVMTDVNGNVTAGSPTVSATNITSASPVLTVNFNAAIDQTAVDVLWVTCTRIAVGSATLPLPSTPVTAQVTMGPTGAALSSAPGNPALTGLTTGMIPRYQQALVPTSPITLVIFPPANTNLLLTFAFVGPGYNTGIAIANTTKDPFTPAGGGAAASEGTVRFLFVKNDGTTKEYTTTTGSPGTGLTGAGVVASGSTYVVNLSELLSAAAFGTTFSGHVFIVANFTHAHGAATIYTTSTGAAALSSPVLVLPAVSAAQVRTSPESAGQ